MTRRLCSFGCSWRIGRVFSLHPTPPFLLSLVGEVKAIHWSLRSLLEALNTIFRCFILIPPICVLRVGEKYLMSPEELYDGCCQSRHNQRMGEGLAMKQTKRFQTCPLGRVRTWKDKGTPPVWTACQYLQARGYPGLTVGSPSTLNQVLEPRTFIKICRGSIGIIVCKDLSLCDLLPELLKYNQQSSYSSC